MVSQNALLGDHNVFFYASSKERQNVLFSNLKTGLDKGCSALYIASEENIEHVQIEMKNFGLKIDDPKNLRTITSHQFYTPDGEFHISRTVEQITGILEDSLDRGFEGLYISADTSKVFDYLTKNRMVEKWLAYEKLIGKTMPFPLEGMCAYHINQVISNDQLLLRLIQAHKNTVTAKNLKFVDNEKICNKTITEELDRILGKKATELIFTFLEKRFKHPRNQILANIVDFNQCLELFFGDGAEPIEKQVLKKLRKKLEMPNLRV